MSLKLGGQTWVEIVSTPKAMDHMSQCFSEVQTAC